MLPPAHAQFLDLEPSETKASEVVGWHPTLSAEANFTSESTLLAPAADPTSTDILGLGTTIDGDHSLSDRWWNAADTFLTPMVPGEAIWVQRNSAGEMRESVRLGMPFSVTRQKMHADYAFGPLAVDFISLGTLGLYSQLGGPGSSHFPDDGYLRAITLNTVLMLKLTDSASLRIRASLYYLYTENRLGFFFGSGDSTAAEFSYKTSLGNWDIQLSDVFRVYFPLSDALDEVQVDEIAIAGRYRLGRTEFVDANPFSTDNVYFINTVSLSAATWLGDNWRLKLHGQHWDAWQTGSFIRRTEVNNLGAGLFYDSPDLWLMPWLMYDWYDVNQSQWTIQHARAGLTLPFSRTLHAYVRGAWIAMESETGRTFERPGWDIGVVHYINRNLSHSIFAGYNFTIDEIGEPFLGSYWRYSLRWAPVGRRFALTGYVQQSSNDLSDREARSYGTRLDMTLSPKTRLFAATGVTESKHASSDYTSRVLRVGLARRLTSKLQGSLTWQMADYDFAAKDADFDEQLIMLDLLWTL